MNTLDKIKVMTAFISGEKIEYRRTGRGEPLMGSVFWEIYLGEPKWNWFLYEYRVKQQKRCRCRCDCCG